MAQFSSSSLLCGLLQLLVRAPVDIPPLKVDGKRTSVDLRPANPGGSKENSFGQETWQDPHRASESDFEKKHSEDKASC